MSFKHGPVFNYTAVIQPNKYSTHKVLKMTVFFCFHQNIVGSVFSVFRVFFHVLFFFLIFIFFSLDIVWYPLVLHSFSYIFSLHLSFLEIFQSWFLAYYLFLLFSLSCNSLFDLDSCFVTFFCYLHCTI